MNDCAVKPRPSGGCARRTDGLWLGAISLAPLILLFPLGGGYGLDWPCHHWLVAYFGEFFQAHLRFPDVLHTGQLAGMHYPVFYGFLLYPALGMISAVTGPELAVRAAVLAVLLLQSREVFRLTLLASQERAFSFVVTAAVGWSTYALTNLYHRAALSEFFAVALLTGAFCVLVRMFLFESGRGHLGSPLAGMLFFIGAAGAHPITATFGAIGLAAVVGVLLPFSRDRLRLAGSLGLAALGIAVAMSPWLYAVLKFGPGLAVADGQPITYGSSDVDSWAGRLMPFPYDARMVAGRTVAAEQVPYLETQISSALLLCALGLSAGVLRSFRRGEPLSLRARSLVMIWLGFFLLLAISVLPALGHLLPAFLQNLQFAYRLVSYLNFGLLLVIVVARTLTPVAGSFRLHSWLLGGAFVLAASGLVIKLCHVEAIRTPNTPDRMTWRGDRVLELPDYFYGWRAYALTADTPLNFPPADPVSLPLGQGRNFGRVQPLTVRLAQATNLQVRIQPFPWNRLSVDGHPVTSVECRRQAGGITISMTPGEHVITYAWQPDVAWVWLTNASRAFIALGLALALANQIRLWVWATRGRRAC